MLMQLPKSLYNISSITIKKLPVKKDICRPFGSTGKNNELSRIKNVRIYLFFINKYIIK